MNIAIIDDERLARMELHYLLQQVEGVENIYEGESIEEAFALLLQETIDLLFLDIHLTDESGLDLAKKIQQVPHPPLIIFATAYDNHAVEAFELNALDYILKPFEQERIKKAVAKAQQTLVKQTAMPVNPRLTIETDERIFLVPFDEILYAEVQGKQTTIHTEERQFITTLTLAALEQQVPSINFLKVHRSYIINTAKITEIQPWFNQTYQVTMSNQEKVPVSRSYVKSFKQAIGL
ncbi:LytTR family DNA-binding domain-containing protein [uncultured Enterococcus sp.]|uniref:LytR/AlgR family response regulator transcription factor n=1 Tax=uncultured Enterococcus sp. TaxID=167972 RepID=UPI0025D208C1|nr:LytTR family transcriptional regulator DNA-binding domain-containing protein [uncultured Enterococcus sp.]